MYRVDLHTHSIISYDGGISAEEYGRVLADGKNVIAITDHNQISFAQNLKHERVIVGEEILTTEGEITGLFLNDVIPGGLSLNETIRKIREQNGLVYIPHPFEKTRKGISAEVLERIANQIDIMEVFNARAKEPWLFKKAEAFALKYNIAQSSSTDAHNLSGFGISYTVVDDIPTRENLVELLKKGKMEKRRASIGSLFAPLRNKIKKRIRP